MKYQIQEVANELMLEPDDLKDVYQSFFEEALEILTKCDLAVRQNDYEALKRLFHALKGSSSNLRMNMVNELALTLEENVKSGDVMQVKGQLPDLEREIMSIYAEIKAYYGL